MKHQITAGLLAGILLFASGSVLPEKVSVPAQAATSADFSISDNGLDFLCGLEGYHQYCYWDYAQSSIGYGTKCPYSSVQPHATGLHQTTKAQAKAAMRSGIASNYAVKVKNQTKGLTMNQNQFDALVSLAYNCGGGLNRIYNCPLTKYLRGQLTASSARSQYGNYIVYAGGTYLRGLHNRRVQEANLFFSTANMQKPTTSNIAIQGNRTVFDTTEEVVFTMSSDYGTTYYLGIDYEGQRLLTPKVASGNTYSHVFEQPGHYSVYVSSYNSYGFKDSQRIEFDIILPAYLPHDTAISVSEGRTLFHTGETVSFTLTADKADFFVVHILKDGVQAGGGPVTRYQDAYCYETTFSSPGTYTVYTSAYSGGYSADSEKLILEVTDQDFSGDLNYDTSVNEKDLILLQNYLQKKTSLTKRQTELADINQDGLCNIYDLLAMKQKLLSSQES